MFILFSLADSEGALKILLVDKLSPLCNTHINMKYPGHVDKLNIKRSSSGVSNIWMNLLRVEIK